jgi:O-antigen/teichoic acid export membrane protein
MLARVAGAALTFFVPVLLVRLLSPASYGGYRQAWLLVSTLHYLLPMGVVMALYYFVPREPERASRFVGGAFLFTLGAGAVAALAVLLGRGAIVAWAGDGELAAGAGLVAAATGATLAGTSLDVALNAMGRIGAAAWTRLVTDVGRGAAMVLGAWATRDLRGLLWGLAVASAVRAVIGVAILARTPGLSFSAPEFRRQLAYALPLGLAALLFVPQQSFHQWAVAAQVSAAAFAIYSVGCFQLPIVDVLYTPVSEVLQLGIAEEERRGERAPGRALFADAVARLALAFIPAMALVWTVAPEMVAFLFTPQYAAAVPIMRVSLLMIPLAALPIDGVLRARAQKHYMLAASAVKLGLTVPFVLLGLRWFGLVGAIGGYLLAEAAVRLGQLVRVARLFEVPVTRVLPLGELGRIALSALLAAPLAWGTVRALPAPLFFRLAAASLVFAAAYVLALAVQGALPVGRLAVRRPAAAEAPARVD